MSVHQDDYFVEVRFTRQEYKEFCGVLDRAQIALRHEQERLNSDAVIVEKDYDSQTAAPLRGLAHLAYLDAKTIAQTIDRWLGR